MRTISLPKSLSTLLLCLCMALVALPLNAQFRASEGREDFLRLRELSADKDKDAYERQFRLVESAARKSGDENVLFDAYAFKAIYYLYQSDVKTNAATLKQLQELAQERHSDYGWLDYYLARAMSLSGQMLPDEALKVLDQAIAICEKHPGDPLFNSSYAHSQKGQTYLGYPKYDEAIVEMETAIVKAGDNKHFQRNPHISLFRLYVANDSRLEQARSHMEWIQQNFPEDEMSHYERETFQFSSVLYHLYLNDTESAQKVVNEMDYNVIRFDCQRRIYECNKDYDNAVLAFQQYIEKNDSIVGSLVEKQMSQYSSELAARALDVDNARLAQANHQLELEQSQQANRILTLGQESHAQRLKTLNQQIELKDQEERINRLKAEQEEYAARTQQEEQKTRDKLLRRLVIYLAGLITLAILLGLLMVFSIGQLRKHKQIAEEARKRAEEANLMKSTFLQNMNHDLRAPLGAIVCVVDLLNDPDVQISAEERNELTEGLRLQSDLLLQLVDDIIDLSALQSGNYHLDYAPVRLNKLCASAIMSFRGRCAEGVEMRADVPEEELVMNTDGKRLLEVIGNLLGNATKYTEQGSIVLSYQVNDQEVEFSVTDTGSGIPESQAATIFDRFEKIGSVKKGFGLGLSICQSVVTLMKGRIWLDTTYRAGARFCFALPRMLALFFFLLGAHQVQAQDNPYHIDDRAYEHYVHYLQNQAKPDAERHLDSLMARARAVHDVKAQCIGMSLYTDHVFVTGAPDEKVRQVNQRCVDFCRRTPYTAYIFSSWTYLVQRLLDKGLYMQALKELQEYQNVAVSLNSTYGKSNGLMYQGSVYEKLRQYHKAEESYYEAVQTCLSAGDTVNISAFYIGYADCLNRMGKNQQALEAYAAGRRYCRLPSRKLATLLGEGECYYDLRDADALEHTLNEIDAMAALEVFSTIDQVRRYNLMAKYHVLRGDVPAAERAIQAIGDVNMNSELRLDLLLLKGEKEAAFHYLMDECRKRGDENQRILGLQFNEFNLSLENTQRQLEQEQLRLRNTQMLLDKAQQEQQLLALENEADSLRIVDKELDMQTQEAQRKLRQREEAAHAEALQREAELASQRFRMHVILISLLVPGLLIGLFVLYRLWHVQRRIARQRRYAVISQREADQANADMDLFMHSMNHEIRTPLNAIIGYTDILNHCEEFCVSDQERAHMVEDLHRKTQGLQLMVNAILDISKMESGTYIFQPEPMLLSTLAEQELAPIRAMVAEGVEVIDNTEADTARYMLDRNRLHVLLSNILLNAQEHTHQGHIQLDMRHTDGRLHIHVQDTGTGIPVKIQSRIFERFTKGDPFADGFGLGLPLCKVIAEKMGGSIRLIHSDQHGTHIAVEIPCPRAEE